MQGHEGAIGSLSETLDFDHGSSSSSNPTLDQQMCWSNMRNSEQQGALNFMLPPGHAGMSVWNLGEPSSSNSGNKSNHDERMQKLKEHQHEPNYILPQNNGNANINTNQILNRSLFTQNSTADLNLNAAFIGQTDDECQVMDYPNSYVTNDSLHGRMTHANSSFPFGVASGSGGFLLEENGGPESSFDGLRLSNKRKAIERNVGQTSAGGSSKGWQSVPPRSVAGKSLSISTPSENTSSRSPIEHVTPTFGLGLENPQRNLRVKITPSMQDSVPMNLASTGTTFWNFDEPSSTQHSSRFDQANHSIELNSNLQNQPIVHARSMPQNTQSLRWNTGPNSRHGTLIQGSLRNTQSHNMEIPPYVPANDLRNLAQNSNRSRSVHGNVASSSRSSPPLAPTWVPHQNPSLQYPRRLSEYAQQSLIASDSGGHHPLHLGPSASLQDPMLSYETNDQGSNRHAHLRSALWIERQCDATLRAPNSLRGLAVAGEGRSRLVSEIRSVLELIRRGEGLRLEDVMILNQSVLLGVADAHDRHRDMRLDVDNMSYEELLALEERIGNVSTGLSQENISNCLKQRKFVAVGLQDQSEAEPCSICRDEYKDGDELGVLLECGHDFHTDCVKQWLAMKNLCPICKTTALPA